MDLMADEVRGEDECGKEKGEDQEAPAGAEAFGAEEDAMDGRCGLGGSR